MKVTSKQEAWNKVNEIFPTDYEQDLGSSDRAGYPIYRSTAEGHYYDYICDLGNRLEVNLDSSNLATVNIWIDAPIEEVSEDGGSASVDERWETARRIQRLTYWYTKEYIYELDNKKREDAAVKEMQDAAKEDGEIKCMALTAENNAKVMMSCITDCIAAVNILTNKKEDVDGWMIAGINAMMDKTNERGIVPYDLPTAICGLLLAQYR